MDPASDRPSADRIREVRLHLFERAAATGRVPQPPEITHALGGREAEVRQALRALGDARALILTPNGTDIWSASPFCAVPTSFRVESAGRAYHGICIWDALGIPAALGRDGVITASCGDCGEPMRLEVRDGELASGEGILHFGVPARRWWDNIGFT